MTKLTYIQALEIAIASVSDTEVSEKLEALKASIAKKSSGERKPTKAQEENKGIKTQILEAMESGKSYTVSEIQKSSEAFSEMSGQKISALVKQLKDEGFLEREKIKRKAYFRKVEA